MNIRAWVTTTLLTTALALPAAAGAAVGSPGDRAIPGKAPMTGHQAAPQRTTGKDRATVTAVTKAAQKPKAAVKVKAASTSRPSLIFVPSYVGPTVESGIGGAENCAAYTGCTDEEYCIVWFLRCELVPAPAVTLDSRRLTAS